MPSMKGEKSGLMTDETTADHAVPAGTVLLDLAAMAVVRARTSEDVVEKQRGCDLAAGAGKALGRAVTRVEFLLANAESSRCHCLSSMCHWCRKKKASNRLRDR